MKIALYFGSFNPVHTGHLIIARHVLNFTSAERLWFVVSPHNPLKETSSLLNENQRLRLLQLAIENEIRFKASNIEFKLPRPSYTIDTMIYVQEKYPQHEFTIVMGSDAYSNIKKWKNYQKLLVDFPLVIYKRPGFEVEKIAGAKLEILEAPLLDISSTFIRKLVKEKKSIRYLVPDIVKEEIDANHYYA